MPGRFGIGTPFADIWIPLKVDSAASPTAFAPIRGVGGRDANAPAILSMSPRSSSSESSSFAPPDGFTAQESGAVQFDSVMAAVLPVVPVLSLRSASSDTTDPFRFGSGTGIVTPAPFVGSPEGGGTSPPLADHLFIDAMTSTESLRLRPNLLLTGDISGTWPGRNSYRMEVAMLGRRIECTWEGLGGVPGRGEFVGPSELLSLCTPLGIGIPAAADML